MVWPRPTPLLTLLYVGPNGGLINECGLKSVGGLIREVGPLSGCGPIWECGLISEGLPIC
mgnify:FL=1